jgi:hypothetical protein
LLTAQDTKARGYLVLHIKPPFFWHRNIRSRFAKARVPLL